jgi:tape measure domain-containing protein
MFTRLEAISRRLGLSLEDTAEGLASFGIAAQQAGFSAQKSEKIFVQVASGLRAAGASSLQTQRAFYALQQMMSKGVVAAEELRRQLGESLPGASDLMTKAYNRLHPAANLTSLEFTKLLESGKIISKDILPEFAMVIEETFAPALSGKSNSLDASLNRVNNEILKLKLNIGNADWFKAAAKVISDSLYELNGLDLVQNVEKNIIFDLKC